MRGALPGLVRRASELTTGVAGLGADRVRPVLPELRELFGGQGLRRGSTVAVSTGPSVWPAGGSSLVLALLAEASRAGSWCAVVGLPTFGAVAAAEAGIALDRLALVPNPGPEWPTVVAPQSIAVAFFFAAAIGIFFGFYPARKASRLDPIDALRSE